MSKLLKDRGVSDQIEFADQSRFGQDLLMFGQVARSELELTAHEQSDPEGLSGER
jgi:hypothetical protein